MARTKALDRVLLHGHYVIPNWHLQSDRTLYWDKFSRPAVTPRRGTSTDYWWFDAEKAARLEKSRGEQPQVTQDRTSDSPGASVTILATIGLLTLGYFVFRHALRRPSA